MDKGRILKHEYLNIYEFLFHSNKHSNGNNKRKASRIFLIHIHGNIDFGASHIFLESTLRGVVERTARIDSVVMHYPFWELTRSSNF